MSIFLLITNYYSPNVHVRNMLRYESQLFLTYGAPTAAGEQQPLC